MTLVGANLGLQQVLNRNLAGTKLILEPSKRLVPKVLKHVLVPKVLKHVL